MSTIDLDIESDICPSCGKHLSTIWDRGDPVRNLAPINMRLCLSCGWERHEPFVDWNRPHEDKTAPPVVEKDDA